MIYRISVLSIKREIVFVKHFQENTILEIKLSRGSCPPYSIHTFGSKLLKIIQMSNFIPDNQTTHHSNVLTFILHKLDVKGHFLWMFNHISVLRLVCF